MNTTLLLITFLLFASFLSIAQCRDCTVTQNTTLTDCVLQCWDKYQGKKDFYDFNSGLCQQRITCGPGYYNDYVNNICIDEFGGYVLRQIGWVITVKEKHVRFAQLQVLKGYYVSHKLICEDGWKSSMRTQKRNQLTLIIYLCDQKLKDGEIYPKTHGEYFFQQLTPQEKITAIDHVFGPDTLSSTFTPKTTVFVAFTCLYLVLNFIACCTSAGKKSKCNLLCKKESTDTKQKLTQSQNKQIEEYLQKRKEQRLKGLGEMKEYSLQGEIKGQLELMNKIKQESQEMMKQKWRKRLDKKEMEKQKLKEKEERKSKGKQNKQFGVFKFLRPNQTEARQDLGLQSKMRERSKGMKNCSMGSSSMSQKPKKPIGK